MLSSDGSQIFNLDTTDTILYIANTFMPDWDAYSEGYIIRATNGYVTVDSDPVLTLTW